MTSITIKDALLWPYLSLVQTSPLFFFHSKTTIHDSCQVLGDAKHEESTACLILFTLRFIPEKNRTLSVVSLSLAPLRSHNIGCYLPQHTLTHVVLLKFNQPLQVPNIHCVCKYFTSLGGTKMFLPLRSNMDKYILFIQFKRKKLPGKCKENNVQPVLQLAFIIINI